MEIKRIAGANKFHGAPANWSEEENGLCGVLPTADHVIDGVPFMVSAWEPLPDELERLRQGAHIFLGVSSVRHPVVFISIGDVSQSDTLAPEGEKVILDLISERDHWKRIAEERLQKTNREEAKRRELEAAIKPFAVFGEELIRRGAKSKNVPKSGDVYGFGMGPDEDHITLTVEHFKAAMTALSLNKKG